MAEAFDPDKYLAEKTGKTGGFDPDKYLAEKLGSSTEPQGELDFSTQSGLGFMSTPEERQRYISKKYPGAVLSKWKDQDIVILPGEKSPRYLNQPGFTSKDIASFVGDIPGAVGGTVGALSGGGAASVVTAGLGAAAGEVGRKAIGRGYLLGEDIIQPEQVGQDLQDVGIAGLFGSGGQLAGNVVAGQLAKRAGQKAIQNIGKETGKKVLTQSIEGPVTGELGTVAAGQAAGKEAEGVIRGELGQAATSVDDAVSASSPKSMGELLSQHQSNIAAGAVPDLPTAQRLVEIERLLPDLKNKPLQTHREMLKSKQAYDVHRVKLRELPGKEREALDAYDQRMKSEIQDKINGMIGPDAQGKTDSGLKLMSDVSSLYDNQKKQIKPLFEAIQTTPIDQGAHVNGLAMKLSEQVPGFGEAISINPENGKYILRPFRPDMGVSRNAYSEMSAVIDSLNQGELSFKGMQRIREYLRKQINPMDPGSTQDLQGIRKAMLNHMEDLVESRNPDAKVRQTFRSWAKNERMLESFEDILGGKMEHVDALYKANPDRVLANIFANPNTVETTKTLLGPERFKTLSGDFIASLRDAATDSAKNEVSMHKFASLLKQKRGVIEASVGKDGFQRLSALADLGKIIPDMPSINPSGTAKTSIIGSTIRGVNKLTGIVSGGAFGGEAAGRAAAELDGMAAEQAARKYFDLILKQTGEEKKNLAAKLLPYAKSKTSRAILREIIDQGRPRVSGPKEGGLINQNIQGPGDR